MEPTKSFLDFLLCGLTETTYNNTISIGQLKSATDSGMVTELRNYIANMNTTGSMALNITKATAYLKNRRREFERQLTPDAGKITPRFWGRFVPSKKKLLLQSMKISSSPIRSCVPA